MREIERLTKRKEAFIRQLAQCKDALSGNLTKAVNPGNRNDYWRITWKEQQKTRILYARKGEVALIKKGIQQFAKAKKLLQQIGQINREIVILLRKSGQRDQQ